MSGSTPISDALWISTFPNIPKPDGCTYDQFIAAEDALNRDEAMTDASRNIAYLTALKAQPHMANHLDELDRCIAFEQRRITNL